MKTVWVVLALAALVPATAAACDYYDPAKSAATTPAPMAAAPAPAAKAVVTKAAATPAKQVAVRTNTVDQKLAANVGK